MEFVAGMSVCGGGGVSVSRLHAVIMPTAAHVSKYAFVFIIFLSLSAPLIWLSPACQAQNQREQKNHNKYHEQDPCKTGGGPRDAGKAKERGDDCNDQEY
jgi:hypothetical protein